MAATPSTRSRHWFGTTHLEHNGGELPSKEAFEAMLLSLPGVRAYSAQVELCPTSQRPHVQWYVQTDQTRASSLIKKKFGHVMVAQRPLDAWKYCQKEETRSGWTLVSASPPVLQGQRPGLVEAAERVRAGSGIREIAGEMPDVYVRHDRGLKSLALLVQEGLVAPPRVVFGSAPEGSRKVNFDKGTWYFDNAVDCSNVWVERSDYDSHGQELISLRETVRIMGGFYPRKFQTVYVVEKNQAPRTSLSPAGVLLPQGSSRQTSRQTPMEDRRTASVLSDDRRPSVATPSSDRRPSVVHDPSGKSVSRPETPIQPPSNLPRHMGMAYMLSLRRSVPSRVGVQILTPENGFSPSPVQSLSSLHPPPTSPRTAP